MHPLLIQQAIIDEIGVQVKRQGIKPLYESKFDYKLIVPALTNKRITLEQRDRWVANMYIEGYLKLSADDNNRNPLYITLLPKGLAAESSEYFKQKHDELKRTNFKYWVDVVCQLVVGITAIAAILISAKSCNTEDKNKWCKQLTQIDSTKVETKSVSIHQDYKLDSGSVVEKVVYDTTKHK